MNIELIDVQIFKTIHTSACSGNWWDHFNLFVSDNSHHIWFVFLLVLVVINYKKNLFPALMCLAGFFIAWHLCDEYLKPFFQRDRPFLQLGTCVYGHKPGSSSFPSGHTLTAFAIAALLILYNKRNWIVIGISSVYACFVGYTRMYLGVHFPFDVLSGAVFGILIGTGWYYAVEKARLLYQDFQNK
jgi:undecaprenyl-diphosphatase